MAVKEALDFFELHRDERKLAVVFDNTYHQGGFVDGDSF